MNSLRPIILCLLSLLAGFAISGCGRVDPMPPITCFVDDWPKTPANNGKIDLNAPVQWRQVVLFDRDNGTVVETWITSQPVTWTRMTQVPIKDSLGNAHMLLGDNILLSLVSKEEADKWSNNHDKLLEAAKKRMSLLTLPQQQSQ